MRAIYPPDYRVLFLHVRYKKQKQDHKRARSQLVENGGYSHSILLFLLRPLVAKNIPGKPCSDTCSCIVERCNEKQLTFPSCPGLHSGRSRGVPRSSCCRNRLERNAASDGVMRELPAYMLASANVVKNDSRLLPFPRNTTSSLTLQTPTLFPPSPLAPPTMRSVVVYSIQFNFPAVVTLVRQLLGRRFCGCA